MVHFLFIVQTPPYSGGKSCHAESAMRLTEEALKKNHQVTLFLIGDGIYLAKKNQRAITVPNVEKSLEGFIKKGVQVLVCGNCATFRGIESGSMVEGVKRGGLKFVSDALNNNVKVISFAP